MELDKYDQALLDGEYGESRQKMMEILLALGKIYDAERFIPVKSVQVSGASFKTIGEAGLEWLSSIDAKAVVPAFLNPIGMPRNGWEELGIPQSFAEKQIQVNEAYVRLGIRPTCTCTPYYFSIVERGDHLAWSESSAVSYANSVLGARTNREGGPSALASALTGKTPEYGLHIVKNRLPQIEFRLDDPEAAKKWTNAEYGALGVVAGAIAGNRIPLFMGLRPNRDMLKSLGAAMAASGAVALYHVNEITPETRFPFFKQHIAEDEREVVTIEVAEVLDVFKEVEVSAVAIGCPHLSREEVTRVAELLAGKKTVMPFYVFVAEEMKVSCAEELAVIAKAGAKVVPDTCMVVSPLMDHAGAVMTNSGKAFSYLPGMCGVAPRMGTLEDCVRVGCGE
ncbi:aconitase X catalytic domain-containing protein [Methanocorpusculum sp. MG]|uniref:Phosphomevalonate dehydratase large subunit n=1 Tax=Methanocorpusculum petauri TaxID=3002863 RepID=A0ABT4IIK4_9EURY|nr:aconitase X catalytic domain-containing protein [Methanocorpusculum petauri]MCZ0861376.1 aconitase X catalytic domain-containing protein [Methanocorpusculum petauri]MDE2444148.1 aconitase X catalytic domain-containing protein [Methanocorpusculum sp.]